MAEKTYQEGYIMGSVDTLANLRGRFGKELDDFIEIRLDDVENILERRLKEAKKEEYLNIKRGMGGLQ